MNKLILIPVITDLLGKQWRQPDQSEMLIDDKFALMDQTSFDKLYECSFSNPIGLYEGKMFKVHEDTGKWFLVLYAGYDETIQCTLANFREIIIL
jgi:hypothetical protein